jgi:hypothetical protein
MMNFKSNVMIYIMFLESTLKHECKEGTRMLFKSPGDDGILQESGNGRYADNDKGLRMEFCALLPVESGIRMFK